MVGKIQKATGIRRVIVSNFDLDAVLILLTIVATGAMSASAAIQGLRQGFDPFGTAVLGVVAAVGGGTVRDLLLGETPIFWLQEMIYLMTAIPIALITHFAGRSLNQGSGQRFALLQYLDAIGLALFTIVGVQAGLDYQLHFISAIVLGCTTGVVGGMLRDVMCGQTPTVLKQDLYATISLIGGAFYILSTDILGNEFSLILTFFFIVLLRSFIIYRNSKKVQDIDS